MVRLAALAVAQAGELVDRVLNRVRDPHAAANSRVFVREVLAHCQRLLNAKLGLVVSEITFDTVAAQVVYPIASLAETALRIVGVREDGRDLVEVKWREFWFLQRNWLRRVGTSFQSYSLVGRDLLVLYPAQAEAAQVTLVAAVLTDPLLSDDVAIQLPDDYHPLLLDLATVVVSLKGRAYQPLKALAASVQERLRA